VAKNGLMKQSLVVVNKAGGAGAEGFLDVKGAKGDPHKIIITLSNLFTTPLAQGTPFNWRDLTPVQVMALDQFVLWVNAEKPWKTTQEFLADVKKAGGKIKMAGTGAPENSGPSACSIRSACPTRTRSRGTRAGRTFRPARSPVSMSTI
jgi:tripartite-type tricarboxylate transporter receptor subunit TctC